MGKHHMPESHAAHPNVTPLIDVVMCLIIFFMLVAKIGVSTGAEAMELPETILGKKIETLGDSLIINVTDPNAEAKDPTGAPIMIAGTNRPKKMRQIREPRVTATPDPTKDKTSREMKLKDPYELRTVLKAIKERREQAAKAKGIKDTFSVTVRAERDLEFAMLQQVLAEIAQAGITEVNYGAKEKLGVKPTPAEGG